MTSSDRAYFKTSSHFGAYTAVVEDGRVVDVEPFQKDPNPSPILGSIAQAVHHKCRISQPMVRKGWLDNGPQSEPSPRGSEPFVPVSWDKAFDLVTAEVDRVKRDFGSSSIFAGSYGWGSAGRTAYTADYRARIWRMRHGGSAGG